MNTGRIGQVAIADAESDAQQMSVYYQELEQLLDRIEHSTTHYQVLGLGRSATNDEIKLAYKNAVAALYPSRSKLGAVALDLSLKRLSPLVSEDMTARIDRAFDRVSQAFSVLANFGKRIEYDNLLFPRKRSPIPVEVPSQSQANAPGDSAGAVTDDDKLEASAAGGEEMNLKHLPALQSVFTKSADDVKDDNRRRCQRFKLSIPARVVGYDRKNGKWQEMAQTVDVSRTGVTVRMPRRVRHGLVVYLTLPLPTKLRSYGYSDSSYSVYALVRRVEPAKKGQRVIGLEFVGANPPEGYLEKPWIIFKTKRWAGTERRRKPREDRAEVVAVDYYNESLQCIRQESALTENVSASGMRIRVKSAPSEFEVVKINCPARGFDTFAAITNRYIGKDGTERLCITFLDNSWQADLATAQVAPIVDNNTGGDGARRKKILIADDDEPLRKVMGKILTQAGYEVVLAEDGKSAIEKAAAEKPDLVITDGLMPKMHGFLVCKTIKEMSPPPKVIMVTAVYTRPNYKWEAREKYGADDLLTKPFEVSDLLACIDRQLSVAAQAHARA